MVRNRSFHRRPVFHFNAVDCPSVTWTAQQLREARPFASPPKYLLRDRDGIYGLEFQRRADALGLDKDAPDPRPVQGPDKGEIVVFPQVGGLHHRCERRAA